MARPSTSIITVCFNAASTIQNCIESVCNQTTSVDHIIIDGCSTDGSLDIIDKYKSKIKIIVSEHDSGIYDAMNKGVKLADTEIIGILNADDFYASSHVLKSVAGLLDEKKLDSCYGDLVYVDADDVTKVKRYWRSGNFQPKKFYWGWMPPHPTFFVRREIYLKYGLFNLEMGTAADYELMLRFLLKYQISCGYIPEVLVKMRAGGVSNTSIKNRLNANRMDRMAWVVNGLKPFPWTLTLKPARKVGQFFHKPGERS